MEQTGNDSTNKELSVTKLLAVSVDLVWKVWTEQEHVASWWGPNGFTNTIHQMDLREGGEWRLTMHGPDDKNYPNKSVFKEIIPFNKLVFQHFNPNYEATITFEPKEAKTLMKWVVLFETVELFETVVKVFKADEGLLQNIEKLENYLRNF